MRHIGLNEVERWASARMNQRASRQTGDRAYNIDLEVLRRILDYAVEHGFVLDNPDRRLKRRRLQKKPIVIPTKSQLTELLATMRRRGVNASADLIELLAYSGCRLSEVVGDSQLNKPPMKWGDIDFARKSFTITQSKNSEPRTIPLFPALEALLRRLQPIQDGKPAAETPVIGIRSAMTALKSASRKLNLPHFTHHSMRHFFCSNAIEAGVDFKAIAGWLGHKDGGLLVARTYGHLRDEHSAAMAKRMTFDAAASRLPGDHADPTPAG